jgi:hypothetical protein
VGRRRSSHSSPDEVGGLILAIGIAFGLLIAPALVAVQIAKVLENISVPKGVIGLIGLIVWVSPGIGAWILYTRKRSQRQQEEIRRQEEDKRRLEQERRNVSARSKSAKGRERHCFTNATSNSKSAKSGANANNKHVTGR